MDDLIMKHALHNAILHNGRASENAVLGKVLSENPELRKNVPEVRSIVARVVKEVNILSMEEQKKRVGSFSFQEKEVREGLPPLKRTEGGVVTRFAPAPTGPLNILQVLRAVLISYLYARQYGGEFILRFEDTDPRVVEKGFYTMIKEDLRSLEVKWDKGFIQSDYMLMYYKKAEQLLEKGKAYICFCDPKDFQMLKQRKQDCPCRWSRIDKNVLGWKGMIEGRYREGKAVVRLITSMQDPNPAMRDPPLLRIVEVAHPLKKANYRVWPLYNFANVIMDNFCGVTHVFRGKEHEHNTTIQKKLYAALGDEPPEVVNFGMMYLPGEKLHTRDIKKSIREGKFTGWDDLRLPTVRSFIRRGFVPEAFMAFAKLCGLSKTDIKIDIGNMEAINRKLIDEKANRYMFVSRPREIDISDILRKTGLGDFVRVKNHPEREDIREVPVTKKLFISDDDFSRFNGREVRLIDLFNITLGTEPTLTGSQEFDMRTPKIQWVSEKNIPVTVLYPGREVKGMGEVALKGVKSGEVVQLLRVGFGRIEKPGVIVFSHK